MISTAVGDEQQINLAILNLEEAAKGSLIMLMHKYTFLDESFNAAAATVPGDDTYGLFYISYECNLAHYLHIVKSMFCFYAHIIRADPKALTTVCKNR